MQVDFLTQIKLTGLPAPTTEYRFHETRKWKFDYCYPERMLAIEIEGQHSKREDGKWVYGGGRHNRPEGYENDCRKYNAATLLGYRVIRVTAKMVDSGEALRLLEEALETFPPKKEQPTMQCDICREEIADDGFGQTTVDTVICLDCLRKVERRRGRDAKPDVIVNKRTLPEPGERFGNPTANEKFEQLRRKP